MIIVLQIRNSARPKLCVDGFTNGENLNKTMKLYPCHQKRGNQVIEL